MLVDVIITGYQRSVTVVSVSICWPYVVTTGIKTNIKTADKIMKNNFRFQ